MERHINYHRVTVAVVLLVCLAAGGGPLVWAGDEGTPRVAYTTDFVPGARVVLLDDEPADGPGLKAGTSGVVICCDKPDCSGRVLVSWNLWRGGLTNEQAACVSEMAELFPTGSTMWVDPSKVRLGLPFDGVGVLKKGDGGCLYLSTYQNGLFHLVIGPEYQRQWFTVLPGAFFRVRGLLNTTKPATQPSCSQADGDVYHPILIPSDWDLTLNSWDRGPFHNLDRVVLVGESNPNKAVDLPRGATGTIICRNTLGAEQSILVSWDLWDKGGDPQEYVNCTQRLGGMFPPGSTWWVSPKDIAKYYESECGTIEETGLCCRDNAPDLPVVGLFVPLGNLYCLPDLDVGQTLPKEQCKVIGLYTPYEELMGRKTPSDPAMSDVGGVIFDSVVMTCHAPNCCNPPYAPGDRVKLLVAQPGGAEGLAVGNGGTVICCNPNDPFTPILVSWDNWTGGSDEHALCQAAPGWFPEKSGLWMACTEIKRTTLPDLCDRPEYRRFAPQTIETGKHLKINGMIANAGGAKSGPFFVDIYLSTDARIARDDYQLAHIGMDLDAGASAQLSWLNPLPETIAPGTYYVGWLIDPDNRVAEDDESNNVVVLDGQLTVTGQ